MTRLENHFLERRNKMEIDELTRSVAEAIYDWDMDREGYREWRPFNLLAEEVKDDYYEIATRVVDLIEEFEEIEEEEEEEWVEDYLDAYPDDDSTLFV